MKHEITLQSDSPIEVVKDNFMDNPHVPEEQHEAIEYNKYGILNAKGPYGSHRVSELDGFLDDVQPGNGYFIGDKAKVYDKHDKRAASEFTRNILIYNPEVEYTQQELYQMFRNTSYFSRVPGAAFQAHVYGPFFYNKEDPTETTIDYMGNNIFDKWERNLEGPKDRMKDVYVFSEGFYGQPFIEPYFLYHDNTDSIDKLIDAGVKHIQQMVLKQADNYRSPRG